MKQSTIIGYVILAARRAGIKLHLIRDLERCLHEILQTVSEETAEAEFEKC